MLSAKFMRICNQNDAKLTPFAFGCKSILPIGINQAELHSLYDYCNFCVSYKINCFACNFPKSWYWPLEQRTEVMLAVRRERIKAKCALPMIQSVGIDNKLIPTWDCWDSTTNRRAEQVIIWRNKPSQWDSKLIKAKIGRLHAPANRERV